MNESFFSGPSVSCYYIDGVNRVIDLAVHAGLAMLIYGIIIFGLVLLYKELK
jgi:hypothetical protein